MQLFFKEGGDVVRKYRKILNKKKINVERKSILC